MRAESVTLMALPGLHQRAAGALDLVDVTLDQAYYRAAEVAKFATVLKPRQTLAIGYWPFGMAHCERSGEVAVAG